MAMTPQSQRMVTPSQLMPGSSPVRCVRVTVPFSSPNCCTRSPGTALLVKQTQDFPHGSHDDGPDALEMARWLAIALVNLRGRPRPPRGFVV
jgi:hypothetical protein